MTISGCTGSFEQVFEAMFGPSNHDAHVVRRTRWLLLQASKRRDEAGFAAAGAELDRMNAEWRAKSAPMMLAAE